MGRIKPDYVETDCGFDTTCWMWQLAVSQKGYGKKKWAGKTWWAHRAFFVMHKGPIPQGMQIDHLCRVPSCVNPAHLEAVTPAENSRRGRVAKLTSPEAKEIRVLVAQGWVQQDIADAYGVHQSTVSLIGRERMWVFS